MNPIFVEYYSHEQANCYKIFLPWPSYGSETIVLCKESEGLEHAKLIAADVIMRHMNVALDRPFMPIL